MLNNDKLYILIDEKLSSGQKMAQSGHAIAQFMIEHPGEWPNSTIVILDAPRPLIREAIHEGACGFQDSYFNTPRACAFLKPHPRISSEIPNLALAR